MSDPERYYLMLTPDLERALAENEIDLNELVRRAAPNVRLEMGENFVSSADGQKELVTILLASAAVIAALTPSAAHCWASLSYSRKNVGSLSALR